VLDPIRSRANPILKRVRAVATGHGAGSEAEILLEGERLIEEGRRAGLEFTAVLVDEARARALEELASAGLPVRAVRSDLLVSASALERTPGCLALARMPVSRSVSDLPSGPRTLLVAAAGIQDPGNLGALARTAEAAGADALLVTRGGCSPWNPKALRGSMGSLLRLPVVEVAASADLVDELARAGHRHVRASTRGGRPYDRFPWDGRIVLWLSAENGAWPEGLASRAEAFEGVTIPLSGAVESLNVTAAAAVLLFAAGRSGGAR